jgi:hypothetical protein
MIKTIRKIADILEKFDCRFSGKWNMFLDKRKRKIYFCEKCLCDK